MNKLKFVFFALAALLIFDSCSIQSRRYRKGFHIENLAKKNRSSQSDKGTSDIQNKEVDGNDLNSFNKLTQIDKEEKNTIPQKNAIHTELKTEKKLTLKQKRRQQLKTVKSLQREVKLSIEKKNTTKKDGTNNNVDTSKFNPLAVASFVLVIASVVLSFIPVLPGVAFLVGFIFSIVALVQLKKRPQKGRGLAIAALVICLITLFLALLIISLAIASL